MKRRSLIMAVLLLAISTLVVAGWEPFGPKGIRANKICFLADNYNHYVICYQGGIFLYNPVSMEWTDFPSGIPVLDAHYLNGEDILVILGCGSNSDGIYSFHPSTGDYTLIKWLDCPNFIAYDEIIQKYYIGHRFGLETSSDGLNWIPVDPFGNRNMVAMAIYQNHLVVSQLDNIYSIWHSDDHGFSWTQSPAGSPMVSDLGFDQEQKLFGIFPDLSYSSGLWSSLDYGYTWEVEFWSVNMKCVGFGIMGEVFTGWDENEMGQEEGIAHWEPDNGTLTFINEGLSSLVINDICINPLMSAIALFCCTDSGAFISHDYLGVQESPGNSYSGRLEIYPNPTRGVTTFAVPLVIANQPKSLAIFHVDGRMAARIAWPENERSLRVDVAGWPPGVYHAFVICDRQSYCADLIIR